MASHNHIKRKLQNVVLPHKPDGIIFVPPFARAKGKKSVEKDTTPRSAMSRQSRWRSSIDATLASKERHKGLHAHPKLELVLHTGRYAHCSVRGREQSEVALFSHHKLAKQQRYQRTNKHAGQHLYLISRAHSWGPTSPLLIITSLTPSMQRPACRHLMSALDTITRPPNPKGYH
ncbi:hypothetical protein TRVL_01258 [Trypanosoma vivax]|nr:hypothetical protein TRVL_01258 [Trypanosoma vivax]